MRSLFVLLIGLCIALNACKRYDVRALYENTTALMSAIPLDSSRPYLKAHLHNKEVHFFGDWQIDSTDKYILGSGKKYNADRELTFEGEIRTNIDDIALFETNEKLNTKDHGRVIALSILIGINIVGAVICAQLGKACYGSCPTFYLDGDNDLHYADAEGFSNAISPSLAYRDVDALGPVRCDDDFLELTMKNEALETHCINKLELLAYPIEKNQRVYHDPIEDKYFLCSGHVPVKYATDGNEDIAERLCTSDLYEWFSLADENNLSSKQELVVRFNNETVPQRPMGLNIHFRQTLMTTYFIYSAMDYMGDRAGEIFAQLERTPDMNERLKMGIKKELGGIDIYVRDSTEGRWQFVKTLNETGPIAINKQFVELPNVSAGFDVQLKLILNKGLWRLDFLGLSSIIAEVTPSLHHPQELYYEGKLDTVSYRELISKNDLLISMPGSEYLLKYNLCPNKNYDLFLASKGYYIEWMRESWMRDKDLTKLGMMLFTPKYYLKSEAENFKQFELIMEEQFWNSRLDTKRVNYENL